MANHSLARLARGARRGSGAASCRRGIGRSRTLGTSQASGGLVGTTSREGTQTAIWLATTCVGAVDACFALGGSSALYETSPLQRRLRDIHTAAQHAAAQQRHYVGAGKLLLSNSAFH